MVNEYNNTYHRTIKMKPTEVKDNTYIDSIEEVNDKILSLKLVIILKYQKKKRRKNVFAKGYTPNWPDAFFVIKKVKNTVPWTHVNNNLNGEEIIRTTYEKELHKTNQQGFRIEEVIRRKGNKPYVKEKGYDNSRNSWIDKNYLIESYFLV